MQAVSRMGEVMAGSSSLLVGTEYSSPQQVKGLFPDSRFDFILCIQNHHPVGWGRATPWIPSPRRQNLGPLCEFEVCLVTHWVPIDHSYMVRAHLRKEKESNFLCWDYTNKAPSRGTATENALPLSVSGTSFGRAAWGCTLPNNGSSLTLLSQQVGEEFICFPNMIRLE